MYMYKLTNCFFLITKMSDMTRRFEVILTSFSSDKCNGQFKFKIKWLFITRRKLCCAKFVRYENLINIHCFAKKVFKLPYVSRLLLLHQGTKAIMT